MPHWYEKLYAKENLKKILLTNERYKMGEGHAFLTIFPKIFNICKIDRFEVFVDINEWKLIKVLLMKALAQMGGVNYHFLTGFSR